MAMVNGELRPNWTVIIQCNPGHNWIGTTYLFFDSSDNAQDAYDNPNQYVVEATTAVVKRPYYEASDRQHLPAII